MKQIKSTLGSNLIQPNSAHFCVSSEVLFCSPPKCNHQKATERCLFFSGQNVWVSAVMGSREEPNEFQDDQV